MPEISPLRLLIAEDDAAIHEDIKNLIIRLGFAVIGDAYNGPQAVALAEQLKPDVVLLDIVMPDPDSGREDKRAGFRATESILMQYPLPIIWLTAYETTQMIADASKLGISAYLVKPVQANELARAITLAHARFKDMQELRRLNANLEMEIAERKRVEAALHASLLERETLIKEVHHRVKNNLASVISLIQLQQSNLNDPAITAEFDTLTNRIHSMVLIHQLLYQNETLSQIDLQTYLQALTKYLQDLYQTRDHHILLDVRAHGVEMDMERAIPCGLITNELVTNALKYAFPASKPRAGELECKILVDLKFEKNEYTLTISDNGVGMPDELDLAKVNSLGMHLVNILGRHQLRGTVELNSKHGVSVRICFPL